MVNQAPISPDAHTSLLITCIASILISLIKVYVFIHKIVLGMFGGLGRMRRAIRALFRGPRFGFRFWRRKANKSQAGAEHGVDQKRKMDEAAQPPGEQQISDQLKTACQNAVIAIFPEICRKHLSELAQTKAWDSDRTIEAIIDAIDNKGSYPKQPRPNLKRKRESDASEAEAADPATKYSSDAHKLSDKPPGYSHWVKEVLGQHFRTVPVNTIKDTMKSKANCLYPTFMALEKAIDAPIRSPNFALKRPSDRGNQYSPDKLDALLRKDSTPDGQKAALLEYKAVLTVKNDKEDLEKARASGTAVECECCCDDFTVDRMIHCNGDTLHWFCIDCSRRNAETQIGLSKYQLTCMSMDGCSAEFSSDQLNLFLDEKTKCALDRIEQETVLRLASLEDLETCPSCPFAAILPPVEIDKEFRCLNPECEQVSCRLCRQETHIPKTCAEAAKDRGHSARRVIEEAMSDALIRRCNKCAMPFVKESGCNKMTCTRPGCRNIQCYICHKSCDYAHFNDPNRGGKTGNCPLFDNGQIDDRHAEEVRKAEEAARQKVAAQNPEVDAELLTFNFSGKVAEDDERRKARPQQVAAALPPGARLPGPQARNVARGMHARLDDLGAIRREFQQEMMALMGGGPLARPPDALPVLPPFDIQPPDLGAGEPPHLRRLRDAEERLANRERRGRELWAGFPIPAQPQPAAEQPIQAVNPHLLFGGHRGIYMPPIPPPAAGQPNQPGPNDVLRRNQAGHMRARRFVEDARQRRGEPVIIPQEEMDRQRRVNRQAEQERIERLRRQREESQQRYQQRRDEVDRLQRELRQLRGAIHPAADLHQPMQMLQQQQQVPRDAGPFALPAAPANPYFWGLPHLGNNMWHGFGGPIPQPARGSASDQGQVQAIAQARAQAEAHAQALNPIEQDLIQFDEQPLPVLQLPAVQRQAEEQRVEAQGAQNGQDGQDGGLGWDLIDLAIDEGQPKDQQRPGQSMDNPFVLDDEEDDLLQFLR